MDYSFSWFTAWYPTPKAYFSQIIGYIPDTIDFIVYWLNQPIVEIFAWIGLVLWFIFRLLKTD